MKSTIWPLALLIAGCSLQQADGPPEHLRDLSAVTDAVPRYEPFRPALNPESYRVSGKQYRVMRSAKGYRARGIASWYGRKFHGRPTASGEPYDMYAMTAAHRTLPIPSYVEVTNLRNGRKVVVRVNDRGPFHPDRLIDLSYAAAVKLGIDKSGTAPVEIRALEPPAAAGRAWLLQVGAFTARDNADRLLQQLRRHRLPNPHLAAVSRDGKTLYRVRLGPLQSKTELAALDRKLHQLGLKATLIVNP